MAIRIIVCNKGRAQMKNDGMKSRAIRTLKLRNPGTQLLQQCSARLVFLSLVVPLVFILSVQASGVDDPFKEHAKLMHEAIYNNNLFRVRALLRTPYVDPSGEYNDEPFMATAVRMFTKYSSYEVIDALLAAGGRIDVVSSSGMTPFHVVCEEKQRTLLNYLVSKLQGKPSKTVINSKVQYGYTPLLRCLQWYSGKPGNQEMYGMVETLLDLGADPNIGDDLNATPLMYAVSNINDALLKDTVVDLLLSKGADPDVGETTLGHTPIMQAMWARKMHVFQALLVHTKNVDARENCGLTALDLAHVKEHFGDVCYFTDPAVPEFQPYASYLVQAGATFHLPPNGTKCECLHHAK